MSDVKKIIEKFLSLEGKESLANIFSDFFEMHSIAIRNSTIDRKSILYWKDLKSYDEREEKLTQITNKYSRDEMIILVGIFSDLVTLMNENVKKGNYIDIISMIFHELGVNSKGLSQFYTPESVADLTARISLNESEMIKEYKKKGKVAIYDPTCGAGALLIEGIDKATKLGIPLNSIYAEGMDISKNAIHMAYVQLSMYGVPAVLKLGDTLRNETYDIWETPVYRMNKAREKYERYIKNLKRYC